MASIQGNNSKEKNVNSKYLVRLLMPPVLSILFVFLVVLWMNNGSINRTNYWSFQKDWFIDLNGFLSQYPTFWLNMTLLGDALILLPILSFLMIWKPRAWAALFGAIPLACLFSVAGKKLLAIPRPGAVLDHNMFNIIGDTLTAHNSLPSGHTITVVTGVTAIIGVYLTSGENRRFLPWVLTGLMIATLLSISRVAVGAHWPLDIIVGAALGYIAGLSGVLLTQRYQRWWRWLEQSSYQYISGIIMLLWSIAILVKAIDAYPQSVSVIWFSALCGLSVSIYMVSQWFFVNKTSIFLLETYLLLLGILTFTNI